MRPAARANAAAGIAFFVLLCRLTTTCLTSAHAQSPLPAVLAPATAGPNGASAARGESRVSASLQTSRPGFEHRTIVRLPSSSRPTAVGGAPIDTSVLVESPPFAPPIVDANRATQFRRTTSSRQLTAEPPDSAGTSLAPEEVPSPAPAELLPPAETFRGEVQPLFDDLLQQGVYLPGPTSRFGRQQPGPLRQFWSALRRSQQRGGIGRDRVALAPLEIETTQPNNNLSLRFESVYGLQYPARCEYFWARSSSLPRGKGPPLPEQAVDYQDIRFRFEAGSAAFSASTEVKIRSLDPVFNANTTGFGDMNIGTKLRLVNGDAWQLSQVFHTYILTGDPGKGLGTGHVSLEPGLLFRYNRNELTYWHGELKFWFPVGADPQQGGDVLKWGLGVSHILYDSDTFAVLPTLELSSLVFLDGLKNGFPTPVDIPIDGEVAINMYPGVRFVVDRGTLVEWGLGGGFTLGSNGWYNGLLRADMRFAY